MGTWSASIFGNDTSCEVKEYFFEQYNIGREPQDIRTELLARHSLDIAEERCHILFALAHCLWQVRELDSNLHSEIKKIVSSGEDLDICKELGADANFLRSRKKVLAKLLLDIETPKAVAKKRVKPPVLLDSVYRNGCCLAFQYEDGQWGAIITVSCEFYKRKATLHFAQTDIKKDSVPGMDDIYGAYLLDDCFDKCSQYNNRLSLYGHLLGSKEIVRLNSYNESFFTIIGYLPEWKHAYGSSGGGRPPYSTENYEEFAAIIKYYFTSKFANTKRTIETVEEINRIFTK